MSKKKYYEINKKIKLFKESSKHVAEDEQPNSNVAEPLFGTNNANGFSVSNENEIIDTIDYFNVSVDNEAQSALNIDQIVVSEEVDHEIFVSLNGKFLVRMKMMVIFVNKLITPPQTYHLQSLNKILYASASQTFVLVLSC